MNHSSKGDFPNAPQSVEELEEVLSQADEATIEALARLEGDILFLGVGGKMGPSMARMARRASQAAGIERRVIGVSRFSSPQTRRRLEDWGVETIACDLLDEEALAALPEVKNVVFMAGFKFGSSGAAAMTWAMNCYLPALVSRKYRDSQIVSFSTGNVYGMADIDSGGSVESDPLAPVGEYAMTALGRERMFQYFGERLDIPMAILRLNYATELRYGVLVDMAAEVLAGRPIDLSTGHVNVIWLGDANAMTLRAFDHVSTEPKIMNMAGPEILSTREVCEQFGSLLNKSVEFSGEEGAQAMLNNGQAAYKMIGRSKVLSDQLIDWTANWVGRGGESLGKPTHFQVRDGKF